MHLLLRRKYHKLTRIWYSGETTITRDYPCVKRPLSETILYTLYFHTNKPKTNKQKNTSPKIIPVFIRPLY